MKKIILLLTIFLSGGFVLSHSGNSDGSTCYRLLNGYEYHCHSEGEISKDGKYVYVLGDEKCETQLVMNGDDYYSYEQVETCYRPYVRRDNPDYISPEEQRILDLEAQVENLNNQNQAIANAINGEEEEYIFQGLDYSTVCVYRPIDTIVRLYQQKESCDIFTYSEENHNEDLGDFEDRNTCDAYENCLDIEQDKELYPDSAIIEGFKLYDQCQNHTSVIRNSRCNMLRSIYVEPLPIVNTQQSVEATVDTPQPTVHSTQITMNYEPQLSQEIKNKVQSVKVILDSMGYDGNVIITAVSNIKGNLIVGSEKYLIAEYLISLY